MSSGRRFRALVLKESLQVLRDPSALLIAFVMPPLLLFMFAFAVSLDVSHVSIGVVMESDGPYAQSLAAAYAGSSYLDVTPARHRKQLELHLVTGELKALVVIDQEFETAMRDPQRAAKIQVLTDGSFPNSASFTGGYAQGVFNNWLVGQGLQPEGGVILQQRFWFNPEMDSRRVLVPGVIAIVMTIIGTLLTALVVAREWERGTMEAIMSTPARMPEIIFSKLLPYYVLGMLATVACAFLGVQVLGVPLRGSLTALMLVSAVFLVPALGQGLLISTVFKNQFMAAQVAIMSGFLPALLLSGFIFEIQSMPKALQWVTQVIPARYFVDALRTVFLAGDIWPVLLVNMAWLLAVGALFFGLTMKRFRGGLD
ncbi:ABC transporter permease [Halieaceae bacterium IMCC14734]|uniref:ABC transporter permease n=1 Tax=Candidatus Litorirhabdus singularis TaxID=2518993 RepID=A0ABT3TFB3_9GAMM|nr:ABC transporter permease [Candidatus Litorirhabdus singularis]MCX2981010.1 ABC transporter permease [Candidatus Litorirhabdus singularis]